jgi:hypothetical protein
MLCQPKYVVDELAKKQMRKHKDTSFDSLNLYHQLAHLNVICLHHRFDISQRNRTETREAAHKHTSLAANRATATAQVTVELTETNKTATTNGSKLTHSASGNKQTAIYNNHQSRFKYCHKKLLHM